MVVHQIRLIAALTEVMQYLKNSDDKYACAIVAVNELGHATWYKETEEDKVDPRFPYTYVCRIDYEKYWLRFDLYEAVARSFVSVRRRLLDCA